MRYLAIILWFCLTNLCFAQEWEPIDFKKWQSTENVSQFKCRIGGMIQNYPATSTSWAEIENDWLMFGDTMSAREAYLKTDVLPNGVSQITIEHNDTIYTITQKPVRLIWLKTDTWNWVDIDSTTSWGTPSVDSNIVKWTGVFPGVDYRVRKRNATVEHGIFFKPAFLDSAIVLYDQRADSLDIALANVMEYTLSANIDDADVGVGNVNKRTLKQVGRHIFGLGASQLHFPGSDTLKAQLVNHRWVKQDGKIYCVEYIQMKKIKIIHEAYPSATIWHNDEIVVIDGQTNVLDAHLSTPDWNYGGDEWVVILEGKNTLIKVENVASELGFGVTISACVCSLYCRTADPTGTIAAYRIFKPWNEGDLTGSDPADAAFGEGIVTKNDWSNDDEEWTTAGCESADDGGSDNDGDGTGADRKATAEDTETVSSINTWYGWDMSTALAQGWYDGTMNENGILLKEASTGLTSLWSTEYVSDPTKRPFWTFTYTTSYPIIKGYTSNNSAGATVSSITLTKPDDVENGNLLLIIAGNDAPEATSTFEEITNWTRFVNIGDGATDCKLACYWRIADGTEASTIDVTTTETDELWGWYIRISNVNQSAPINDVGTALLNSNSSTHAITEATTDVDNCLVIYALSFDGGDGYPFSESNTGWVEEDEQQSGSSGTDACGCWGIKALASQGGAGTVTITSSDGDGAAGIQFAIAGAVAAPAVGQVIIIN